VMQAALTAAAGTYKGGVFQFAPGASKVWALKVQCEGTMF